MYMCSHINIFVVRSYVISAADTFFHVNYWLYTTPSLLCSKGVKDWHASHTRTLPSNWLPTRAVSKQYKFDSWAECHAWLFIL